MMKQKCQGKIIMQVDIEVLDEKKYKEHLRNLDYSDSGSIEFKPLHEVLDLEKIVRSHKTGCPYNDTMVKALSHIIAIPLEINYHFVGCMSKIKGN